MKSSFKNIENKINIYIKEVCEDWDQDYDKLKKYIILDYLDYSNYEKYSILTIWYNNFSHDGNRNKVLGGHSITFEIKIVDGKLELDHGVSLNG